jgi:hypothetical protein
VRVEIRKENAPHKEPHLHVNHSDKIHASLRLKDLGVVVGKSGSSGLRDRGPSWEAGVALVLYSKNGH